MSTACLNPSQLFGSDFDPRDPHSALLAIERVRGIATSDLPLALQVSQMLLALVTPDSPVRSRALALRGHVLCYANDFSGAMSVLDEAVSLAQQAADALELGHVQLARVQALARLGRSDEALAAAQDAYDLFSRAGASELAGKAAANLGVTLRMKGRIAESLTWFDFASAGLSDAVSRAAVESNRAEALLDLDRYAEARAAFEAARSGFAAAGHQHAAAIVEGNLADLQARFGDVDASIELFESAIDRFERTGAQGDAARLLAEYADMLRIAGAPRRAVRMYRKAIPLIERHALIRESARAALGLGMSLQSLSCGAQAAGALGEAVHRANTAGDQGLRAECELARALLAGPVGDAGAYRSQVHEALTPFSDRPTRRAIALCGLVDALPADSRSSEQDLCEPAELIEADRIANQTQLSALRHRVDHTRGRWLLRNSRPGEALPLLERAIESHHRLRGLLGSSPMHAALGPIAADLHDDAAAAALDAGLPDSAQRAYLAIERSRLAEHEHRTTGSARHPEDAQLRSLLDQLRVLYARLGPLPRSGIETAELREDLVELEDRVQRRLDLLAKDRELDDRIAPVPLDEARWLLPEGCAAILYFDESASISALVISAAACRVVRRLAPRAEVRSLVRRMRLEVDRTLTGLSNSDGLLNLPAMLAERFIKPLIDRTIPIDRLLFSPTRELQALPLPAAAAQAGFECASWTPSLSSEFHRAQTAARNTPGERGVLIVGVDDELAPGMQREARAIASLHPGAQALIGTDADASSVLSRLGASRLVHLACHGVYDPEFPLSSRILLSDRYVTARELTSCIAPGTSLILAGCDTGRTGAGPEQDHAGLTRAALSAGANCVIGSQWALDDQAAERLFTRLHAQLVSQGPASSSDLAGTPAALAHAQRESIARKEPWPRWAALNAWGGVL